MGARRERQADSGGRAPSTKASLLAFGDKWDKKRCYFKKQSGEVADNKGLATKNKPEQTQKQSGEVL